MRIYLLFIFFLFSIVSNAQSRLWSLKVSEDAFMSQLEDGKILLKDGTEITLVDHLTGEVEWQKKIAKRSDPEFLKNLPIMLFEGKPYAVIDATNGYIIDSSKEKTEVLGISYFWEAGRVVLELNHDDHLYILNINLKNPKQSWKTNVGRVQKKSLGTVSRASKNPPYLTQDGSLVIVDNTFISVLQPDGVIKKRIEFQHKIKKVGFNKEKTCSMFWRIKSCFTSSILIKENWSLSSWKIKTFNCPLSVTDHLSQLFRKKKS